MWRWEQKVPLHTLRWGNPLLTGRYRETTRLKSPVLAHLDAKPVSAHSWWIYVSFNPSTKQPLLETVLLLLRTAARSPWQRRGLKLPFSSILYCIHFMFSNMSEDEWFCRKIPEDNSFVSFTLQTSLLRLWFLSAERSDLEPLWILGLGHERLQIQEGPTGISQIFFLALLGHLAPFVYLKNRSSCWL